MSEDTATKPTKETKNQTENLTYNADAVQNIPLQIQRGNRTFHVSLKMNPIDDETFFSLMEKIPENAKKVKGLSIDLLMPLAEVGKSLAVSRHGYKERKDWRENTHPHDFISAVQSMLHVVASSDTVDTDELLDDDAETPIELNWLFNGVEGKSTIWFREEDKSQMDEYLSAINNEPSKIALASHKKESKERRLYRLYEQLKTREENYSGRVPAHHAIEALAGFMNSQLQRLGKFPNF